LRVLEGGGWKLENSGHSRVFGEFGIVLVVVGADFEGFGRREFNLTFL